MNDNAIEIGDFWITKKNPIECEVIGLKHGNKVPIITSYSAEDDCTDSCTQYEFLRDYEFLRKGSESESDKDWVCSGCNKPISDCLCLIGDDDDVDMVNHPPHYKDASGIECIEVTKHMQFCGGSCFMHLYEAGKKDSTVEGLKKAKWYAERAWIMNEVLNQEAMNGVRLVAKHRTGNIAQAMNFLAEDCWGMVEMRIEAEIARLEIE